MRKRLLTSARATNSRSLSGQLVAAGIALLLWVSPVLAITAGDVLNKMTEKERFGYITGAIDMAMYLEQVPTKGPTHRSKCILDWFYRGPDPSGPRQVISLFRQYPEKSPEGLILVLIDRACPRQ